MKQRSRSFGCCGSPYLGPATGGDYQPPGDAQPASSTTGVRAQASGALQAAAMSITGATLTHPPTRTSAIGQLAVRSRRYKCVRRSAQSLMLRCLSPRILPASATRQTASLCQRPHRTQSQRRPSMKPIAAVSPNHLRVHAATSRQAQRSPQRHTRNSGGH